MSTVLASILGTDDKIMPMDLSVVDLPVMDLPVMELPVNGFAAEKDVLLTRIPTGNAGGNPIDEGTRESAAQNVVPDPAQNADKSLSETAVVPDLKKEGGIVGSGVVDGPTESPIGLPIVQPTPSVVDGLGGQEEIGTSPTETSGAGPTEESGAGLTETPSAGPPIETSGAGPIETSKRSPKNAADITQSVGIIEPNPIHASKMEISAPEPAETTTDPTTDAAMIITDQAAAAEAATLTAKENETTTKSATIRTGTVQKNTVETNPVDTSPVETGQVPEPNATTVIPPNEAPSTLTEKAAGQPKPSGESKPKAAASGKAKSLWVKAAAKAKSATKALIAVGKVQNVTSKARQPVSPKPSETSPSPKPSETSPKPSETTPSPKTSESTPSPKPTSVARPKDVARPKLKSLVKISLLKNQNAKTDVPEALGRKSLRGLIQNAIQDGTIGAKKDGPKDGVKTDGGSAKAGEEPRKIGTFVADKPGTTVTDRLPSTAAPTTAAADKLTVAERQEHAVGRYYWRQVSAYKDSFPKQAAMLKKTASVIDLAIVAAVEERVVAEQQAAQEEIETVTAVVDDVVVDDVVDEDVVVDDVVDDNIGVEVVEKRSAEGLRIVEIIPTGKNYAEDAKQMRKELRSWYEENLGEAWR